MWLSKTELELELLVWLNSLRVNDASRASWSIVVSQSLAGLCCWFIVWLKYGFRRSSISLGRFGGSDSSVWHMPSRTFFGERYGSSERIGFRFLSGQSIELGTAQSKVILCEKNENENWLCCTQGNDVRCLDRQSAIYLIICLVVPKFQIKKHPEPDSIATHQWFVPEKMNLLQLGP